MPPNQETDGEFATMKLLFLVESTSIYFLHSKHNKVKHGPLVESNDVGLKLSVPLEFY